MRWWKSSANRASMRAPRSAWRRCPVASRSRSRAYSRSSRARGVMHAAPVAEYLKGLQDAIVARVEALDGGRFTRDTWTRAEGGGGLTCILEGGTLMERAGVGFSRVTGT